MTGKMVVKVRKKQVKKQRSAPVTKKEVSALGQAIRALGGAAGTALGGYAGHPLAGGAIGTSLGAALSKWLGSGDYNVTSNSIVRQSMRAASNIPVMHNDQQSVIIRHKEYLCEVRGSTAFSVQQSFPLNPGVGSTFPWLSNIAASFQEYRIRGMVFHYVPTSGMAVSSTNTSLGSVMLQTSYRASDAAPNSKVELLNEFWSNEVVPSDTMAHPIECDPKENPFNVQYIRSGAIPSGDTQLMYDLGTTHLAVSGTQSTISVLGDLWVTYEIELKKPLLYSNVTSRVESASGIITAASGLSSTAWFGTSTTLTGSLPVVAAGGTLTFPLGTVGVFFIEGFIGGNTLVSGTIGAAANNCVLAPAFAGDNPTTYFSVASSTNWNYCMAINITNPSTVATVVFSTTGTGTFNTNRIAISQVS